MNWIKDMFESKINKEAATDATQEFEKKIKASPWIKTAMEIDEPAMAKEADARMEAEIAIRKEAAYEAFQDTEEVLKQDYSRDVEILSDFTIASMIAEMRGHTKQDFPENATKYFEEAKADVKKDRKAVEKELLSGTGMSAQLDWRKSFADYKKDETPKQVTEKELYQPKLEDVNDDLSKGGKVDAYAETDEQHAKTMLGVGREEKERTDVTAQPGEVHKDASLNKTAEVDWRVLSDAILDLTENDAWQVIRQGDKIGVQYSDKGLVWYTPEEFIAFVNEQHTASLKTAALVRDPDTELHIGTIVRLARSVMTKEGFLLPEGSSWEVTALDGYHYTISANGKSHTISGHDSPKFNKLASQNTEIENHATREQILIKIAEIQSPWVVTKDEKGNEVVARVTTENTNTKESVEESKENLSK